MEFRCLSFNLSHIRKVLRNCVYWSLCAIKFDSSDLLSTSLVKDKGLCVTFEIVVEHTCKVINTIFRKTRSNIYKKHGHTVSIVYSCSREGIRCNNKRICSLSIEILSNHCSCSYAIVIKRKGHLVD